MSDKIDIEIKNRYTGEIIIAGKYSSIKDALEINRGADLRGADLSGADLSEADLSGADLSGADLSEADLSGADLSGADLSGTDLRVAGLRGANLDYSVLYFGCGSFSPITDRRQRIQLAFHWAQWVINSTDIGDDEKEFVNNMLDYINEFHRNEIPRLVEIK